MECRHFGTCGGCSIPNVPYAEQLERKRARLAELLDIDVPPLVPSPLEAGFRSKVAFVFGTAQPGGALVMGHYAFGSRRVVPVEECPVHAARGNRIAFALRDRLARAGIRASDARGGILRHIIVRANADESEAVAMLVVTRNDKSLRAPIRGLLGSADRPDGFFVNVHDKQTAMMIGDDTIKIDGRSHVRENRAAGERDGRPLTFLVSPTAFFQTNIGAARALVQRVQASVGSATRILELYCGSGLFTLPLAAAGASVTAVEENRQAIADLETNMKTNRIPAGRIKPICGRVEDVVARLVRERPDVVVLDPPRSGCAPGVLQRVVERIAPPRIVYVSCNPEALAADLAIARSAGYEVERVDGIDMFPHTDHIEAVATIRR